MVLVPRSQRRLGFKIVVASLLLLSVAGGFFMAGYFQGIRQKLHVLDERSELKRSVADLTRQKSELQEQLAIYKHGGELERKASERLRQDNIQLQDRNSELERSVAFYKGIMAPENNAKGLKIDRLEIDSTPNRNRYRIKVVLTQVADNSSYISGTVRLTLLGVRDGERESIPFTKISQDFGTEGESFKFRYFQDLVGEIVIPDEVIPEQIEVIARSSGRKATRLERKFDWNYQEVTSHVGKG